MSRPTKPRCFPFCATPSDRLDPNLAGLIEAVVPACCGMGNRRRHAACKSDRGFADASDSPRTSAIHAECTGPRAGAMAGMCRDGFKQFGRAGHAGPMTRVSLAGMAHGHPNANADAMAPA